MKARKTITKNSNGYTFVFVYEPGRGYRTSASGFGSYWYQSNTSVREANRRMKAW
jgi:hypothetical protein